MVGDVFKDVWEVVRNPLEYQALENLKDSICLKVAKTMIEDDQKNVGNKWCLAKRVDYCANTDESVANVFSNQLTSYLNTLVLQKVVETVTDIITSVIFTLIRGADEAKEEAVVEPLCGLIPWAGTAVCGLIFEPLYVAFKTVLDPPARIAAKAKIREKVAFVFSQIMPHILKLIEDELEKGDTGAVLIRAVAVQGHWLGMR